MFSENNVRIYTHIIAMVLFSPGFQSVGSGVWVSRQLGKKINIYNRAAVSVRGADYAACTHKSFARRILLVG